MSSYKTPLAVSQDAQPLGGTNGIHKAHCADINSAVRV